MVMVYSEQLDRNLVIRAMRADAREFLSFPLVPGDMDGALARVSIREPAMRRTRRTGRKLFVVPGSKGSCGVTAVANSFAALMAQESRQNPLLIDRGSPLGDTSILLGTACGLPPLR